MRLGGNCFITLLSGLLDNDTPHCKGGGETGRKNGFSVIGNIKIIHAGRRGERSEGWMCKPLRSGFLLTQVECGCRTTPYLRRGRGAGRALTSGGKVKRNSPFSSSTSISINWGLPHSPINFRIKFRLPSRLPWQAFSLLGNSLWCANLGQEGVCHPMTVQL